MRYYKLLNAGKMEKLARRNNLRVDGVKEPDGETWDETEGAVCRAPEAQLKTPADQVRSMGSGEC